jgi:polysaccharide pyruvyl transferase WcaK-like protein
MSGVTRELSSKSGPGRLKIGFLGNFGMWNTGNDASLEAVLSYVQKEFPDARIDAMCFGPKIVEPRFGIPAIPLYWSQHFDVKSRTLAKSISAFGKIIDVFRTAAWVRRHDVVLVPGMGVLETSLPVRPWSFPFTFFLASAFGRMFGVKVILLCVGATAIRQRVTRQLYCRAANLAYYRSYRDAGSKEAMLRSGVDAAQDEVYTDLVFSLSVPPALPEDKPLTCLGVMDYRGSNDDRKVAAEIRSTYISDMVEFAEWLIDHGRRVRMVIGDTNGSDDEAMQEILARVADRRPDLDPGLLEGASIKQFSDLLTAMQPASTVVAIRYHNIVAALMLGKPTIAISYSSKQTALLEHAGLSEFGLPVREITRDRLVDKFTELEERAPDIRATMAVHRSAMAELIGKQFAELTEVISGREH